MNASHSTPAVIRRPRSSWQFLMALLGLALPALAGDNKDFLPLQLVKDGADDAPAMAYALKDTFMTEAEWDHEVKALWSRFQDWEKQSDGDINQYLNDRLIIVAMAAAGGKIEKVKKGIAWLAFYKEFNAEPPSFVTKFFREHRPSLTRLFTDFTWEKASQYVKNKEWRKDYEERRRLLAATDP